MGKHRWKGELAKPIRPKVIRPRGLRVTKKRAQVANEEMEDLYRRAIAEEYLVKLNLLMDDYGITDKSDYPTLALTLAKEFVPGFKIDPTPLKLEQIGDQGIQLVVQNNREGRPPKWPSKRFDLLSAVDEMKKKHSITDHEALSRLTQRSEWSPPGNYRGDREQWLKTLKNQLAEARHFSK
jgi:hypothetical protein